MTSPLSEAMAKALSAVRSSQPDVATKLIQDALGFVGRSDAKTPQQPPVKPVVRSANILVPAPATARSKARHRPSRGDAHPLAKHNFACSAGARDYLLHLPAKPRGLLVMLHGCKQNAEDFAVGTRMNDVADSYGLAVLYPMQSVTANPSACWNWFQFRDQERTGGEAEILASMTADVLSRHSIAPRNVFAAGLSAGGAMAAILGSTYPELYTAIGVHSGLPYRAASDVSSAFRAMRGQASPRSPHRFLPRLITFQGAQDRTVVQSNARGLWDDAVAVQGPGRVLMRESKKNGRRISHRIFMTDSGNAAIEEWIIDGLHHNWSGGNAGGTFTDPAGPDASREMLRFMMNGSAEQ